jgi:hypothetical protein
MTRNCFDNEAEQLLLRLLTEDAKLSEILEMVAYINYVKGNIANKRSK